MHARLLIEGKNFGLKEEFCSEVMNYHFRHSLLSPTRYDRDFKVFMYRITPQKMTLLGTVDVDFPIIRTRAKQVSILKVKKTTSTFSRPPQRIPQTINYI